MYSTKHSLVINFGLLISLHPITTLYGIKQRILRVSGGQNKTSNAQILLAHNIRDPTSRLFVSYCCFFNIIDSRKKISFVLIS